MYTYFDMFRFPLVLVPQFFFILLETFTTSTFISRDSVNIANLSIELHWSIERQRQSDGTHQLSWLFTLLIDRIIFRQYSESRTDSTRGVVSDCKRRVYLRSVRRLRWSDVFMIIEMSKRRYYVCDTTEVTISYRKLDVSKSGRDSREVTYLFVSYFALSVEFVEVPIHSWTSRLDYWWWGRTSPQQKFSPFSRRAHSDVNCT